MARKDVTCNWLTRVSAVLCLFALPTSGGQFPSPSLIGDPGDRALVSSSQFLGRNPWVFPALSFSRQGNITSWVFRGVSSTNQTTITSPFLLWLENENTPNTLDFELINQSRSEGQVELVDPNNRDVFQFILNTPLPVEDGYVFGVTLPQSGSSTLEFSFVESSQLELSYYLESDAPNVGTFITVSSLNNDSVHLPLVSPVFGSHEDSLSQTTLQPSTASNVPTLAVPSNTATDSSALDSIPPTSLPTASSPHSTQPTAIIIGAAVATTVAVVVITSLVLIVVLVKCRQRRFGKGKKHLENPTYQVPENGTGTGKSTSSNGSYHAYAIPTPSRFVSATLPPLPSHCTTRLPTPTTHQHYEFSNNIEDSLRSHLYDLPGKAATMPLPYEVPMANREPPKRHHVYSELECGEFPAAPTSGTQQEEKKSLISDSHNSLFDNSIYKGRSKSVRSNSVELLVTEDLYWKPASSSILLYDQLARRKFREIMRDQIQTTDHLGSGQFGMVSKGAWQSPDGPVEVAVKQLQLSASEEDRVKFLQEAAIMGQFSHPNVVKLHGVVTKEDPIMIVLEYMPNGDLRNYLLSNTVEPSDPVPAALPHHLLRFCREVASGMNYLSKKAFVHRDLAARNILLDCNDTSKIGDFGMSRDLEDSDYYITHGGKIPVKWTAPEALHYKKYSTASDVWSFGCLMYEIWSLGHKPFEQYSNLECIHMISNGFRLPPPPGCSRALYELMIQCWHREPSKRPNFTAVLMVLMHLDSPSPEGAEPLAGQLGGPLEAGEGLYSDLQRHYYTESGEGEEEDEEDYSRIT